MTNRTDRVDELLRQEIGTILSREMKDPRVGFATVTRVETTPDLRHARVWVGVIGQQGEREQTLAALEHVMHFVRRELGARLRLRRIPDLHVRLDDSAERGTRIMHLLDELEAGHVPDAEGAPVGETLPTPTGRLPRAGDAPEDLQPAPPDEGQSKKHDASRRSVVRRGKPSNVRDGGKRSQPPRRRSHS